MARAILASTHLSGLTTIASQCRKVVAAPALVRTIYNTLFEIGLVLISTLQAVLLQFIKTHHHTPHMESPLLMESPPPRIKSPPPHMESPNQRDASVAPE